MRKITWDDLTIEITRRCQLECKHCFRGKRQDCDISKNTIDALLEQTEIIGRLAFTGGEPTLNLDMIEYFLDQLYERKIPLFKLHIITNGYEKSQRFVEIVKKYSEMIQICYLDADIDIRYYVTIGVSDDRYHSGNAKEALKFYRKELKGYAKVLPVKQGNMPIATGNAKYLPEAIVLDEDEKERLDTRIEILSKDLKPLCPYYKTYNLLHEDQVYVICEMQVSSKGDLTLYRIASNNDYDYEDENTICNVKDDIFQQILIYNKGKKLCIEKMKRKRDEENDFTKILKNYIRMLKVSKYNPNFEDDLADLMANKHFEDPIEHAEDIIDGKYETDDIYNKDIKELETDIKEYFDGRNRING